MRPPEPEASEYYRLALDSGVVAEEGGGHLLPLLLKFWTVGQLPENLFRVENFFIKNAKFEANSHVGKSLHGTIAISSTRNCFGRKVAAACRTIATFCPVYLFILRHR